MPGREEDQNVDARVDHDSTTIDGADDANVMLFWIPSAMVTIMNIRTRLD